MRATLLGPLETRIMDYFWKEGSLASIAEVHSHLQKNSKLAYTTVATVVGRLSTKGLLKRKKIDGEFVYFSTRTREQFLVSRSRGLVKSLLGNFGDLAIASFIEEVKTDPESLRTLRELTNEG